MGSVVRLIRATLRVQWLNDFLESGSVGKAQESTPIELFDGGRMKAGGETVCERGDRSRWSQNLHLYAVWSFSRWSPSVECEELQMVAGDEVGLVGRRIGDD